MPSTRRAALASVAAGCVSLAGCTAYMRSSSPDDPPPSGVDELPTPDGHVFGANGEWSSFGCNASNTRAVGDGKAPVDGVTERWRVEVAQLSYREPVVAGGRVYYPDHDALRVFDAADGSELWTLEDVRAPPLVRDGVVYAATHDAVRALEAETGEELWRYEFDGRGSVMTPATYAGRYLICGAGERLVALEPEDGTVEWEDQVFGQLLEHAAIFFGAGIVVATEAGMVYLIGDDGRGWWRWQLPARPTCPPTLGRDSIYVACENGTTYALMDDGLSDPERNWAAETGWVDRGIALADGLVLAANGRQLEAFDSETGDRYWEYDTGGWRHTAPAYGRDTVFVGGDRLWAIDPTPGDDPKGGPAVRFKRAFAGRVGPGPVLEDGTLYVVARVEEETYALLALE